MKNEEHKMMLDTLNRFLNDRYPLEKIREIDEKEMYPRQIVKDLARLGLTGLTIPEKYGGTGRDIVTACLVTEELAKRSLTLSWVYVGNVFFGAENINQLGSEEEKITVAFFVPTMIYTLLDYAGINNYDLSSIRLIEYGASPMAVEKLKQAISLFGNVFSQWYGLSEAPAFVLRLNRNDHLQGVQEVETVHRLMAAGRID